MRLWEGVEGGRIGHYIGCVHCMYGRYYYCDMYVMQCVVGSLCESLCSCGIVTVGGCVCAVVIVHERIWTVWRRNTVMVCGVCNGRTIENKKG